MRYLIGIDEVGRGPLAGPLCVGAVCILERERLLFKSFFRGVRDSKQLTPNQRLKWYKLIIDSSHVMKNRSLGLRCRVATVFMSESLIDRLGLGRILKMAVARVLAKLSVPINESKVLLDGGLKAPSEFLLQKTIIKGDEKEWLIALASIVAKVRRDHLMSRAAKKYPAYGFEKHKGYGTRDHYNAIRKYGLCKIHRKSFLKTF